LDSFTLRCCRCGWICRSAARVTIHVRRLLRARDCCCTGFTGLPTGLFCRCSRIHARFRILLPGLRDSGFSRWILHSLLRSSFVRCRVPRYSARLFSCTWFYVLDTVSTFGFGACISTLSLSLDFLLVLSFWILLCGLRSGFGYWSCTLLLRLGSWFAAFHLRFALQQILNAIPAPAFPFVHTHVTRFVLISLVTLIVSFALQWISGLLLRYVWFSLPAAILPHRALYTPLLHTAHTHCLRAFAVDFTTHVTVCLTPVMDFGFLFCWFLRCRFWIWFSFASVGSVAPRSRGFHALSYVLHSRSTRLLVDFTPARTRSFLCAHTFWFWSDRTVLRLFWIAFFSAHTPRRRFATARSFLAPPTHARLRLRAPAAHLLDSLSHAACAYAFCAAHHSIPAVYLACVTLGFAALDSAAFAAPAGLRLLPFTFSCST